MDDIFVVAKIQKLIKDNMQSVVDSICTGGVDNMEKYQYMLGQIRTYQLLLQEISNLLDEKEQKEDEGNIIKLGSTED
ncbi:MAG: hypothetical protein CMI74_09025 [Candidatus Pelagibacter sp.]|jgi:hypothetical protein|nr:hypothetical protein [Candidatus Pelagibacter sp.]